MNSYRTASLLGITLVFALAGASIAGDMSADEIIKLKSAGFSAEEIQKLIAAQHASTSPAAPAATGQTGPVIPWLGADFKGESLEVSYVHDPSPGSEAGLQAGDKIARVGNKMVHTQADLVLKVGVPVTLHVVRSGVLKPVAMTPAARPEKVMRPEDQFVRAFLRAHSKGKKFDGAVTKSMGKVVALKHVQDYEVTRKFREQTSPDQEKYYYKVRVNARSGAKQMIWDDFILRIQAKPEPMTVITFFEESVYDENMMMKKPRPASEEEVESDDFK